MQFDFGHKVVQPLIVVPSIAVGEDDQGKFVFVLQQQKDKHWVAKRRAVATGSVIEEGFLITEGLSEGELIATAGIRRIQDGMEVKLIQSKRYIK